MQATYIGPDILANRTGETMARRQIFGHLARFPHDRRNNFDEFQMKLIKMTAEKLCRTMKCGKNCMGRLDCGLIKSKFYEERGQYVETNV